MTPLEMFRYVVKTITDFLKLLYCFAVSMAVLHLAVSFMSYQFLASFLYCDKVNYYDPLNCLGMLTLWGTAELTLASTALAYAVWKWCTAPPALTFSPDDAERLERDQIRRGRFGSNESLVKEFMSWAGTAESYKEDSPYVTMTSPSWQFSVWRAQGGDKKTLVGHGCRISGHLVVNYHVLSTAPQDQLYLAIIRPGKETVVQSMATFVFTELLPDICVCPIASLKGVQFTGLKEARVKHVQGFQPAYIATDFPDNNASTAAVINHPEAWGMLQYKGSTRPGFSGATYVHGSSLFGIHCHGGLQNVGYSASYVALKLKNNESSDYFALQAMLNSSRDRDYQSHRVNPDEYEIRYQGRYFIIEADEYMDLEDQYGDASEHVSRGKKSWRQRHDWENAIPLPPSEMREVSTQTVEFENAPQLGDGFAIQQLTHRVDLMQLRVDSEREHRLEFRQEVERFFSNIELRVSALEYKMDRYLEDYNNYSSDDDIEGIYPPGAVFENAPSTPPPPEQFEDIPPPIFEEPAQEQPAPNSNSPTQVIMGGATSDGQGPIVSQAPSQNPDHSLHSQMASLISGLQQQQQQSELALRSIRDILEQQTAVLSRLTPESNSRQRRGSASVTAPATQAANRSSRRTRGRGSRQPGGSIGRGQPDSVSSPTTNRSETRSAGMASASRTGPTGRSSNSSPPAALTPSQQAAAAALKRNRGAQPAPQTSSSS